MPRVFQISEDHLGELERILPDLGLALMSVMDNRLRTQIRRCQSIMTAVRWRYGPPGEVVRVDASDEPDEHQVS